MDWHTTATLTAIGLTILGATIFSLWRCRLLRGRSPSLPGMGPLFGDNGQAAPEPRSPLTGPGWPAGDGDPSLCAELEQLRARNRILETIVAKAPVILWCTDAEGTITVSEGRGLAGQGIEPGQVVGQSIFEVYREYPEFLETVRRALNGESFSSIEETLGASYERWFQPLTDEHGKVEGVIGVSMDISSRREAERNLRASQRLLRTVVDSVPHSIFVKDLAGEFVMANTALAAVHGLEPEEVVGRHTSQMPNGSAEENAQLLALDREVIESGKPIEVPEIRLTRHDGTPGWRRMYKAPLFDDAGRVAGVVGISEDVSERRRMKQELEEKEQRMRALLDSARAGFVLMDADLRIRDCNRFYEHNRGVNKEQLIGGFAGDVLSEEEAARRLPIYRKVLATQQPIDFEDELIFPGKARRAVDFQAFPVADGVGVLGFDVTEHKRTEEELRTSRALLQTVFDAIPQSIAVVDAESRLLKVNQAWRAFHGVAEETVLGRAVAELDLPCAADLGRPPAGGTRIGGEAGGCREGEHTWTDRRGRERVLQTIHAPIRSAQGGEMGFVSISMDVTGRRRAEREQERERLLFRTVLDSIPSRIVARDATGRKILGNRAFADTLGLTVEQALALPAKFPLLPPEQAPLLEQQEQEVLTAGKTVQYERQFEWGPGRKETVMVTKVPLREPDGSVRGVVVINQDISQRKQAELELAASRHLLRTVLDTVPNTIAVKDLEGRYLLANKAMEREFGVAQECLEGNSHRHLPGQPEELYEALSAQDRQVVESRQAVVFENIPRIGPDGTRALFHLFKAPLLAADGKITGIVAVGQDVTSAREMENRLEEGRGLLQTVFDTIPHWVFVKDAQRKYRMVNHAVAEAYGVDPEAVIGKKGFSLETTPPEEIELIDDTDRQVLEMGKRVVKPEYTAVLPDGRVQIRRLIKLPWRDPSGKIAGVVGISEDITEQKKAERELGANRNLLQTVFDTLPVALSVKDREGRFLLANKRMLKNLDVSEKYLRGLTVKEIAWAPEEVKHAIHAADRKVIETGETLETPEMMVQGSNGEEKFYHQIRTPLRNGEGEVVGLVAISEDVTGRKAMEEQLRQAQKMEAVGQLAGGVAHDFNNMLQIIQGYTELAILTSQDNGADVGSLERVLGSAKRASNLTRQLLAFSRQQVMQPRDVAIGELIDDLMKLLGRLIGENIVLKVTHGKTVPLVQADPGMLEQVLMNLCVNARDAMPEGGILAIETGSLVADEAACREHSLPSPGDYATITVRDTGTGIDGVDVPHIFEPFFTTKETGKGTGLGLSVVYGIVKQHEGRIAVHSEPGRGSEFTIYLPVAESAAARPVEEAVEQARGGSETILVAEDEEDLLGMMRTLLEDQGYRVLAAGDGEEACEIFEEQGDGIDLVILDVVMPRLSGRKAYERIRQMAPSVPIFFSTGYSSNVLDADFLAQTQTTLLQKPYAPELLFRAVRSTLDAPKPQPGGEETPPAHAHAGRA